MITMAIYAKIRRLHVRDKLSISEIARRTSLSRNTIRKWLRADDGTGIQYRRTPAERVLTPFEPWLLQALKADAHRLKRERRTALMLFEEIQKQGFASSYSRVSEFVRRSRERGGGVSATSAFVPLKFKLGEAFQFEL